jgi:hypothetical protein
MVTSKPQIPDGVSGTERDGGTNKIQRIVNAQRGWICPAE